MPRNFQKLLLTEPVRQAQEHYYGRSAEIVHDVLQQEVLSEEEIAFIRSRDSFYLATVSANNWPYIQHRGGRRGFLHVLDSSTLAFADYRGNRQLLSTGNLAGNARVVLFLMDYPRRERLKILGHARIEDVRQHPELIEQFVGADVGRIVERLFFINVVAFDWNCSQHITPRYTADEVQELLTPLKHRIAELETKLKHEN